MTTADFAEFARAVNNWGRWGADDQRGTLNFITEESVRAAAALVRDGKRLPLAIPLSADGPQLGFVPGRTNPERTMIAVHEPMGPPGDQADRVGPVVRFNDDAVTMGLQAATHWDALAHVSYDDRMYNGVPPDAVDAIGASRLGAGTIGPVVGRGVLLDLPAAAGVERLDGGYPLTPADLERAEQHAGVRVGSGDIVLLRTGQMQLLHAGDKVGYCISTAGPSLQTVRWFHDREVAAVATDNLSFEVFPGEVDGLLLPVHMLHIVEMGLLQGQNFDLEALAADCADDGRYAFLLSATPEPFVGGAGAPVVPVAIK
ncbi:MAG TPA: cyclase family protein [Mycobacteriales bacterium]|nr:cyclase family protein [Mycobacteriales bacterium]